LKFSKPELKTKSKWEVRKPNMYCLHTHSYSGKYLKTIWLSSENHIDYPIQGLQVSPVQIQHISD
jgi:hypothetical protein